MTIKTSTSPADPLQTPVKTPLNRTAFTEQVQAFLGTRVGECPNGTVRPFSCVGKTSPSSVFQYNSQYETVHVFNITKDTYIAGCKQDFGSNVITHLPKSIQTLFNNDIKTIPDDRKRLHLYTTFITLASCWRSLSDDVKSTYKKITNLNEIANTVTTSTNPHIKRNLTRWQKKLRSFDEICTKQSEREARHNKHVPSTKFLLYDTLHKYEYSISNLDKATMLTLLDSDPSFSEHRHVKSKIETMTDDEWEAYKKKMNDTSKREMSASTYDSHNLRITEAISIVNDASFQGQIANLSNLAAFKSQLETCDFTTQCLWLPTETHGLGEHTLLPEEVCRQLVTLWENINTQEIEKKLCEFTRIQPLLASHIMTGIICDVVDDLQKVTLAIALIDHALAQSVTEKQKESTLNYIIRRSIQANTCPIFSDIYSYILTKSVEHSLSFPSIMGTFYISASMQPRRNDIFMATLSRNKFAIEKFKEQVNSKNKAGKTPLFIAAQNGCTEIVIALLEKGAEINHVDKYGESPLLLSAEHGHTDIVNALLEKGAEINHVSKFDESSPLLLAAEHGHTDIVNTLLKKGAEINHVDKYGSSPLLLAARHGYTNIVIALLKKGAEINLTNKCKKFPLLMAAVNGHSDIVNTLLEAKAKPNLVNVDGISALLLAAKNGHTDIVFALLKNSAEINHRDKKGRSPLFVAAAHGQTVTVNALLEKGAKPNLVNKKGTSPLLFAAASGHTDIVFALLKAKAEPNLVNEDGHSALLLAAENGHTDIVIALLENGAEINNLSKDRSSSLLLAAKNGHTDTVNALLNAKAKPNLVNKARISALLLAATNGHTDIVIALLKNGAEINHVSKDGSSSLLLAIQNEHTNTVNPLLNAKAKPNLVNKDGISALLLAAKNGHTDIVIALLEKGAEINHVDKYGSSPLLLAVKNEHTDIVNALLKAETKPNLENKKGSSPFWFFLGLPTCKSLNLFYFLIIVWLMWRYQTVN